MRFADCVNALRGVPSDVGGCASAERWRADRVCSTFVRM